MVPKTALGYHERREHWEAARKAIRTQCELLLAICGLHPEGFQVHQHIVFRVVHGMFTQPAFFFNST